MSGRKRRLRQARAQNHRDEGRRAAELDPGRGWWQEQTVQRGLQCQGRSGGERVRSGDASRSLLRVSECPHAVGWTGPLGGDCTVLV